MENRKYMTVAQMGEMLGLKKTDSYWLVHKKLFETKKLAGKTLVVVSSFEKWYENQIKYHKVCGTEPGLRLRKHSYSARDISILLDVSEQTAYNLIRREGLKTILVDGWKRVPVEEFESWLNSQTKYSLHDYSSWEPQSTGKDPAQADDKEEPEGREENPGSQQDSYSLRNPRIPPGYITPQQASALAGVSGQTIRHWAEMRHFSQRKVGNRIYIPEEEFRTWLKNREEGGIANGSDHGKKRQV